ncbi:MAG: response regulator, partial [Bacteroidales bacterium]|nr:response regulator [Bacteroidales bacterium]
MNHPDWKDKTILIAEDEKINYLFMKTLFAPTGVEILWASNGEQAIDICRTSNHVDLVLMDRMMLDREGKEATRQIKVVNPDVPVIGQTS